MQIANHGELVKVSAIIPCLNESETIGACITKALAAMQALGIEGEVVVSDNGSSDDSPEIARRLGARVVHQPVRGYGAALQAGIENARGEYLIMADADGSYDWSNLAPFIEGLDAGAELVMGNRFAGGIEPGAMPFLNKYLGNPVLSWLTRAAYNLPVGDLHCGMRAFTRTAYARMNPRTPGMEFATEMVVRAHQAGLRLAEVPIVLSPDGRSGPPHLRPFTDGWRHLRFILSHAPNHLFILPGAALFTLGVLLQLVLLSGPVEAAGVYLGIHFLALGCLLSLVGFSVANLGVLAKLMLVESPQQSIDSVVRWLVKHFSLERGLVLGGLLFSMGAVVDCALLYRWLFQGGAMDDSVHMAFIATNLIAIAVNIIFSSFLIGLLLRKFEPPAH